MILLILVLNLLVAQAQQGCQPDQSICQIERRWTEAELFTQIDPPQVGEHTYFVEDETLTFVLHRADQDDGDAALLWTNMQMPLSRVEDTDYWTATMQMEGLEQAIVTFGFADGSQFMYPYTTYYGPDAPPLPPVNDNMAGQIETVKFESEVLDATRTLTIYLPPDHDASNQYPTIYMTDGEILPGYVGGIDFMITENIIPPVIIVGVASAPVRSGQNIRGEEYVIGRNPELFEKHAQFFTEEVRLWAEETLGATTDRQWRGIFGVSNGGLFAITMSVQHPELYGYVFPFSAGAGSGFERSFVVSEETIQLPLFVYGTAGTLEPVFLETSRDFAEDYETAGATVEFSPNVAGHDDAVWKIEFVNAVRWLFEQEVD